MGHPVVKRTDQHSAFLAFDNSEERKWITIIAINIELFFWTELLIVLPCTTSSWVYEHYF
jgi:hypothetical protein